MADELRLMWYQAGDLLVTDHGLLRLVVYRRPGSPDDPAPSRPWSWVGVHPSCRPVFGKARSLNEAKKAAEQVARALLIAWPDWQFIADAFLGQVGPKRYYRVGRQVLHTTTERPGLYFVCYWDEWPKVASELGIAAEGGQDG